MNADQAYKSNGNSKAKPAQTDLGLFLEEEVYPALYDQAEHAFVEFGFRSSGTGKKVATLFPTLPIEVQHRHADRLTCYADRPWQFMVHGHGPIRWLDYVNHGRRPTGADFLPAVRALCEKAKVPFPEREMTDEEREQARRWEERRTVLAAVVEACGELLWTEAGRPGREYLNGRGFTDEDLRALGIGFYPTVAEVKRRLKEGGCDVRAADDASLLWRKLEGYLVIPWNEARGGVLTLYTRWPGTPPLKRDLPAWRKDQDDEARIPKTLALPGDGTKGVPLFFDRVLKGGHRDTVVGVEGVTDGAMAQCRGDTRTFAYVGASLTQGQIETLARHTVKTVIIVPDPDSGGDNGACSSVERLTARGIAAYVARRLPDGLDPDEFITQRGIDAWREHLRDPIPGVVHLVDRALGCVTPDDPELRRREAADAAVAVARKAKDARDRTAAYRRIAERTGYDIDDLKRQGEGRIPDSPVSPDSPVAKDREDWPALRLGGLPDVEAFPVDVLPDLVARLVEEAAGAVGCEPGMVAGPILAIAGGLSGRSVNLMIEENWFASACIYHGTIALPGDGKTHALAYAKAPLEIFEQELVKAFDVEKKRYKSLKGEDRENTDPPVPQRLMVDDMTMEAAFRVLASNPRGLVMPKGELSSLILGLDQYRNGRGNDRPNLLKVWDGDAFTIDRAKSSSEFGEPVRIPHPHLCITGNLPPAMLAAMVSHFGDDGLIDRWLFTYPDRRPKLKTGQRRPVSNEAMEGWIGLARDLWSRPMAVKEDRVHPHVARFTAASKAEFCRLWDEHVDEVNASDFPDLLRGPWAKMETYAGRLCLILTLLWHAANRAADPHAVPSVPTTRAVDAWRLVHYFKSHARRVRSELAGRGLAGAPEGARLVLNWLRNHPDRTTFPQSDLTKAYPPSRGYDKAALEDGINWLVRANALRMIPRPARAGGAAGRPPSPEWEVHPDLPRSARETRESGESGITRDNPPPPSSPARPPKKGQEQTTEPEREETRRASEWLMGYLYREPAPASVVIEAAALDGLSEADLRAALATAGVDSSTSPEGEVWSVADQGARKARKAREGQAEPSGAARPVPQEPDRWLTVLLCFGPRPAAEIIERAATFGITEADLRAAHSVLPLIVFDEGGREFWKLEGVDQ